MSGTRPSRAHIVAALTSAVLLLLIFGGYYDYKPGRGARFHPRIDLSQPQVLSQIHSKPESTNQLVPQAQIGSDIDLGHCSPTILPFADTQTSSELSNDVIPNIVHYVWLLNGHGDFSVDFKLFISAYSAWLYFRPDTIYVHTDASAEQWEKAETSGNEATRWMLSIPNVVHHWIKPPKYTLSCREIKRIEHVSDFVRTQQLYHYGGIYMDADVLPLRDVRKLRESGFSNIVGIEDPGKINNGFMMSKPRSALMSILMSEQHRVFDNEWLTHSVELLSTIAYRLQAVPGEVMILGVKAFAPSSWRVDAVEALFNPHDDTETSIPKEGKDELPKIPIGSQDTIDYWVHRNWEGRAEWEIDYSSSYVIHAFDGMAESYWPERVNFEYVMARQSNLARAVYPAIKHAVDAGIIDRKPKAKVI
ncbi:MAG: hypothetical protein M1818_005883 [Claussenomyces sp. TS43310]|nr:MAG: hypothetical protein M1818_005883 [Claussenomyces sp. TS43310]